MALLRGEVRQAEGIVLFQPLQRLVAFHLTLEEGPQSSRPPPPLALTK
jgi:hypothetical protein